MGNMQFRSSYLTGLVAVCVTSVILTSFYYHRKERSSRPMATVQSSITPLKNNKTLIISAYYDNREINLVRVISILHVQEVKELYCWFYCGNEDNYVPVRAKIDVHPLRFNFPYGTTDLLCYKPLFCSSRYVSIHSSSTGDTGHIPVFEIKNRELQTLSVDFTVCISTLFGNSSNVLQYVQAIEMFKLLGAQKVVIYKNSCSKAIGQVVDYYISEGVVEVVPWPIDLYLLTSDAWHHSMNPKNEIGYYGQIAALSDCLYRNMYKSRYVAFNDIDEIILPRKHKDWKEMVERLQNQHPNEAVFLIENHYYPISITDSTFSTAFPTNVPGNNILQYIVYEPEQPGVYNNHKMIVNPRKVIRVGVHSVVKAYGGNLDVANNIAGLHHSRKAKQPNLPLTSLIRDTTLWKYNASLINSVNGVLKNLGYS